MGDGVLDVYHEACGSEGITITRLRVFRFRPVCSDDVTCVGAKRSIVSVLVHLFIHLVWLGNRGDVLAGCGG